ncbi:MAG: CPBP family intramembrane metalloprotease [Opitutales bacterium]|nr:CPBP family intramembrane metalloprotease [Opitutales bacterium]
MINDPLITVAGFVVALWLLRSWSADARHHRRTGISRPYAFPGASFAPTGLSLSGAGLAIALVLTYSIAEWALGAHTLQSTVSLWQIPAILSAPVIEEIVFRGYLVIQSKGRPLLILSILLSSALFAIIHPYGWQVTIPESFFDFANWSIHLNPDLPFRLTTLYLFVLSLLCFALRFHPRNPNRSLLPCFCAHFAANIAVLCIKSLQGFVS